MCNVYSVTDEGYLTYEGTVPRGHGDGVDILCKALATKYNLSHSNYDQLQLAYAEGIFEFEDGLLFRLTEYRSICLKNSLNYILQAVDGLPGLNSSPFWKAIRFMITRVSLKKDYQGITVVFDTEGYSDQFPAVNSEKTYNIYSQNLHSYCSDPIVC